VTMAESTAQSLSESSNCSYNIATQMQPLCT